MAKARIHVTKAKTTTRTTARVAKSRNKSGGNPHICIHIVEIHIIAVDARMYV